MTVIGCSIYNYVHAIVSSVQNKSLSSTVEALSISVKGFKEGGERIRRDKVLRQAATAVYLAVTMTQTFTLFMKDVLRCKQYEDQFSYQYEDTFGKLIPIAIERFPISCLSLSEILRYWPALHSDDELIATFKSQVNHGALLFEKIATEKLSGKRKAAAAVCATVQKRATTDFVFELVPIVLSMYNAASPAQQLIPLEILRKLKTSKTQRTDPMLRNTGLLIYCFGRRNTDVDPQIQKSCTELLLQVALKVGSQHKENMSVLDATVNASSLPLSPGFGGLLRYLVPHDKADFTNLQLVEDARQMLTKVRAGVFVHTKPPTMSGSAKGVAQTQTELGGSLLGMPLRETSVANSVPPQPAGAATTSQQPHEDSSCECGWAATVVATHASPNSPTSVAGIAVAFAEAAITQVCESCSFSFFFA